ncbi:MAG: CAAX prenyl protease-related protein [Gammaproteobacteria bacterium]|nr:CAAX prenyl protease-related protein [Gammaproteobacteria bacterium]
MMPKLEADRPLSTTSAYLVPMAIFVGATALEGLFPSPWYPIAYTLKIALATLATVYCARRWRHEITLDIRMLGYGLVAGLLSFMIWVGVDPYTPHFSVLGTRAGFNPFDEIASPAWRAAFIVVRLGGLALLVPIIEEVFWRSFLLRYVTNAAHWQTLPLAAFSARAVGVVAVCFALVHPEWLVALLFALTMALLLRITQSLFCCIVAHATTNLALGVFVLTTGNWQYW